MANCPGLMSPHCKSPTEPPAHSLLPEAVQQDLPSGPRGLIQLPVIAMRAHSEQGVPVVQVIPGWPCGAVYIPGWLAQESLADGEKGRSRSDVW